jgi:nicotinamidase/pyrazinamidase
MTECDRPYRRLLIVVDEQNDFVSGVLGTPEAKEAVKNTVTLLGDYSAANVNDIIFTHDTHYSDYNETQECKMLPIQHCIIGTPGWNLAPELENWISNHQENGNITQVNKTSFGFGKWNEFLSSASLYGKSFGDFDEITVVGLCTDICVISNVLILKALYPETPIKVKASCCAGTSPKAHQEALDVMKSCQVIVE